MRVGSSAGSCRNGCSNGAVSPFHAFLETKRRAPRHSEAATCSNGAVSPFGRSRCETRACAPTQRGGDKARGGYRLRSASLVLCALFAFSSCQPGKRLTKANVDEVMTGMAKKQVESILGMPTSVDLKDYELKQKTTYLYRQGPDTVTIVFWEDRVETKETTLTE